MQDVNAISNIIQWCNDNVGFATIVLSTLTLLGEPLGVRYSKEDIKRRKVERKFDKRSIKKNWRLQTPVKKQ